MIVFNNKTVSVTCLAFNEALIQSLTLQEIVLEHSKLMFYRYLKKKELSRITFTSSQVELEFANIQCFVLV